MLDRRSLDGVGFTPSLKQKWNKIHFPSSSVLGQCPDHYRFMYTCLLWHCMYRYRNGDRFSMTSEVCLTYVVNMLHIRLLACIYQLLALYHLFHVYLYIIMFISWLSSVKMWLASEYILQ